MIISGMGQPPLFTVELTDLAQGNGLGLPSYFTAEQMVAVEDFVLNQVLQVLQDAPIVGGADLGPLRRAIDALVADRRGWARREPGFLNSIIGDQLPTGKAGKDGTLAKTSFALMQQAYREAAGVAGGTQTEQAARSDLTQNLTHPLANPELPFGNLWAKYKTPVKVAAAVLGLAIAYPYARPLLSRMRRPT